MGHAAVPGGIVGDEGFELESGHELPAGVFREPVRAFAKGGEPDVFEEVDCGGNGEVGDGVARAAPDEFVGPGVDFVGRQAAPTEDGRPDEVLLARGDVEKAGAEGATEPFVATGGVKIAV